MIALKILEIKNFMARLLQKEDFDAFLLSEAQIQAAASYRIDGHRNHAFYSQEEFAAFSSPDFLRWDEVKPLVFQMVRGSRTPQLLAVMLRLPDEEVARFLADSGSQVRAEDISGAYFHIKFQESELYIVTGMGFQSFVMDKAPERALDAYAREFLKERGIAFEEG